MIIKLNAELCTLIGVPVLRTWGLDNLYSVERTGLAIDLTRQPPELAQRLSDVLAAHEGVRWVKGMRRDIAVWLEMMEGKGEPVARNVEMFTSLLSEYLSRVPEHRIYHRSKLHGAMLCYYVESVVYSPPKPKQEAYCVIQLCWIEFAARRKTNHVWYNEGVKNRSPSEVLARSGYFIDSPELRAAYDAETAAFEDAIAHVGRQYRATGIATDNVDGNPGGDREAWWWQTQEIRLDRDDGPAHVVVDLFKETDKKNRHHDGHSSDTIDFDFWPKRIRGRVAKKGTEAEVDAVDPDSFVPPPVPVHAVLACFDLRRHLRLRVHFCQLQRYVYDTHMLRKLVLPKEVIDLVGMLLAKGGGFKDIVAGKSGGTAIMCAGPAGTGKTLTAEVYAESIERPLYSVQASQLGLTPAALEGEMLKVFSRAKRWGAILLIDEADVYVSARGSDLVQNAIVGVLLRVIEYYSGVLFMTTNRGDMVDDAIASRCIARIDFKPPGEHDQKRIWRILADGSGAEISDPTIEVIATKYPLLSGRDVKNLLKLSALVTASRGGGAITSQTIEFVMRFKPTQGDGRAPKPAKVGP